MGSTKKDSFTDSDAAKAFGFAMGVQSNPASQKGWESLSPEELSAELPDYEVEALIGQGGMGAVYRAVQRELDRPVALKLLPPGLSAADPSFAERFASEARLMAKLAHPNIVTVYGSGRTGDGWLYYAMELLDGTDMAQRIASEGRIPPEQTRAVCACVCAALSAAHEVGIVHRDIKPGNILIDSKGTVKVADFGLARLDQPGSEGLTLTGYIVGTPEFTAPEANYPGAKLDGRADLYSLGVALYQMLTGTLPRGAFRPASELVRGLDPNFDLVVSRALQSRREDRYQSAAAMRHDLEQLRVVSMADKRNEAPFAVPVGKLSSEERVELKGGPPPVVKAARTEFTPAPTAPGGGPAVPKHAQRKRRAERRARILAAGFAVLVTASVGLLCLLRLGEGAAKLSYDLPFLFHKPGGADDIIMIHLERRGDGRLDRSLQAPLLDALRESGARAAVYDILFDEEWPEPEVDAAFAEAMRRFRAEGGYVILAAARDTAEHLGIAMERIVPPCDELLDAADDFGLVALVHDSRYVVRELPAGTRDEASLAWKAASALGAPLDESRRLDSRWINYAGPPQHPDRPARPPPILSLPAGALLEGADRRLLEDKIAVIGGQPDLLDRRPGEDQFATPYHRWDHRGRFPLMAGVEVQANALANLLHGSWLERSSGRTELALVLGVALFAGAGLSRLRPASGLVAALAALVALALAGLLSIHYAQVWFPWAVGAFVQLPVAYIGGTASKYYLERHFRLRLDAEQKRLREAFAKYVSPKMLERFSDEDFHLDPGGEKTRAAMMFTDIENFSTLCEQLSDPFHVVGPLNDYFQRTTDRIFEHDGIVIKYIGDAIFAAWGVPFEDEQAVAKSVRAAWHLHLNASLPLGGDSLRTRMGLHCGEVIAGNIGSDKHVDYTLIGDPVNVASRIEQLNKALGTTILLSDEVASLVGEEFRTRRVGDFRLKGRRQAVPVHELLGPASTTPLPEWAGYYAEALAAFERGSRAKAKELFKKADDRRQGGDGPSRYFLETLEHASERGGNFPVSLEA